MKKSAQFKKTKPINSYTIWECRLVWSRIYALGSLFFFPEKRKALGKEKREKKKREKKKKEKKKGGKVSNKHTTGVQILPFPIA